MQDHVAAMCRSCFFQLRQLRTIRSSLTTDAAKTLAQAFVGGWLDYCNSLLYGVSGELLRRLQSVQNAAARFITGTQCALMCSGSVVVTAYDSESGRLGSNPEWGLIY